MDVIGEVRKFVSDAGQLDDDRHQVRNIGLYISLQLKALDEKLHNLAFILHHQDKDENLASGNDEYSLLIFQKSIKDLVNRFRDGKFDKVIAAALNEEWFVRSFLKTDLDLTWASLGELGRVDRNACRC